jgi:dihydrolipoamide dehydrogenase
MKKTVLSSTGILFLQKLPEKLLILGAGAIGAEFAYIRMLLVCKFIGGMMERILPLEDEEVSNHMRRSFSKRGIKIYTLQKQFL